MTPTFALTLDSDGIALLKRDDAGWKPVGSVGIDDPDLGTRLMELRSLGEALSGDVPFATKLVLPNSQILYTQVPASGRDGQDGAARAAKALEGATPYALEELAYDWAWAEQGLCIAAVARETLEEAEDFASLHRFNPVSFVAVPPDDGFPAEPFFGPTGQAAQWMPTGETPRRDNAPVRVLSGPAVETASDPRETDRDSGPEKELAASPPPGPAVPDAASPPIDDTAEEPTVSILDAPITSDADVSPTFARSNAAASTVATERVLSEAAATILPEEPPDLSNFRHETDRDPGEAPFAEEIPLEDDAPPLTREAADADEKTSTASSPSFKSKRGHAAPDVPVAAKPAPPAGVSAGVVANGAVQAPPANVDAEEDVDVDALAAAAAASLEAPSRRRRSGVERATPDFNARRPPQAGSATRGRVVGLAIGAAALLGFAALWTLVLDAPDNPEESPEVETAVAPPEVTVTPGVPVASSSEGALQGADDLTESSGAPAPEADTASIAPVQPEPPSNALEPLAPSPDSAETTANAPAPQPIASGPARDGTPEAKEPDDPLRRTMPDPAIADAVAPADVPGSVAPEATATGPVSLQFAAETYVATGIWMRAPEPGFEPDADSLDTLEIAAIDPVVRNEDAFALPEIEADIDRGPRLPTPPRHPDAKAEVGAGGLVIATEAGTLSPGGVLIHSGRPFIVPPRRTASLEESVVARAVADDPLAEFRPLRRPGDLVETTERAVFGGLTRAELSGFRPRSRPVSEQEVAESLDAAKRMADAETATAQDAGEIAANEDIGTEVSPEDAALAADLASATRRAVPASPVPRLRPANISQIADRALRQQERDRQVIAQATAQAAAEAEAARSEKIAQAALRAEAEAKAKAEAVAKAEAEAAERARQAAAEAAAASAAASARVGPAVPNRYKANPTGPTPAAVARRATLENAVALNRVSLIGVYGTSNERRALVRLPSGKYLKVKVGDRLDGGRVATISASELKYSKGGRSVTLKMPKG
ncbi:hypothetical protein [Tropicimonas marinistellae]|uniref:hypothetical protein n=1 Tax=Tropicimonas marinistellae TaxID=1739787 RepID=UPI00082ED4DD|nr:hypothetical protein [Tropicimonas marinistellae]